MSRQRIKKWDERAAEYLGLPSHRRADFRAQFSKRQFDAAMVRVSKHLRSMHESQTTKLKGIGIK